MLFQFSRLVSLSTPTICSSLLRHQQQSPRTRQPRCAPSQITDVAVQVCEAYDHVWREALLVASSLHNHLNRTKAQVVNKNQTIDLDNDR